MPVIAQNDFVLVTNNRRDFLELYADTEVHNGLIIVIPMVERSEQIRLFGAALGAARSSTIRSIRSSK